MKVLSFLLVMVMALPALADPQAQPLSPVEVEALPFNNTRVAYPNVETIYEEIDTHAAADHAEKAGLPQFNTSTFASQIFWLAVMFIVLYFYFAKAALPKISSTIEQRRATVRGDLEQAEKLSADIDQTRADYEDAIKKAHEEARTAITDVETHLRKQAELQASEFNEKSMDSVAAMEAQAEEAKEKIRNELDEVAKTITSDIVAKLTSINVSDTEIKKAIAKTGHSTPTTTSQKKAA